MWRAFLPISQKPEFSQVWDLCKNTANIIKFLIDQIQSQLMTQFLINSKNHIFFWPILSPFSFPYFWGKKSFLKNPALLRTTLYGFLASCQNLEKFNDTIQRKRPDRRTEGPYFIGPFRL